MSKDKTIYCGVEGSICNKGYKYFDYSICCIECNETCSNCTIKTATCSYQKTKSELKAIILDEYTEEKERIECELREIKQKIADLNTY